MRRAGYNNEAELIIKHTAEWVRTTKPIDLNSSMLPLDCRAAYNTIEWRMHMSMMKFITPCNSLGLIIQKLVHRFNICVFDLFV